ncbi:hypothetical protein WJN01_13720 [Flavobacteriaceae bacterium SZ-1-7]|uniref:hypothetical protein n=1 Tax=Tamlana sedimenti TaxID=3134126 RepID=UPI003120CBAC
MGVIKQINRLIKQLLLQIKKSLVKLYKKIEILLKRFFLWFSKITWRSILNSFLAFLGFYATIWGFNNHYKPKVKIVCIGQLKDDDLFTSNFCIDNTGECNIYDVNVDFFLKKATITNKAKQDTRIRESFFEPEFGVFKIVTSNKRQCIKYDFLNDGGINFYSTIHKTDFQTIDGELEIYVEYKYWRKTIEQTKKDTFKFISSKFNHGKIKWIENQ